MIIDTLLLASRDDRTVERITEALDAMSPRGRLLVLQGLSKKSMVELWKLYDDVSPVSADFFVPSGTDELTEVIHHGKNSLPAHNFFQKRFCKGDDETGELWGYNHQSLAWATGPGYYVAHDTAEDDKDRLSPYVIDYTRIPPKKPDSWPEILPQKARLGRFVYAGMKDYMRGVSEHMSIGKAVRGGQETENYFVLCRDEPEDS